MNRKDHGGRENGVDRSNRAERGTTVDGQHPTSNIEHPTSKGKDARRAAYDLEERLLAYAVKVVRLVDLLRRSRGGDHLGGQLLRSGTSPALNHGEAQAAESLNDFIHKMKICLKELRESRRTLRIIQAVPLTSAGKDAEVVSFLIDETEQLIRIFFTAIRTATSRRELREKGGNASPHLREDASIFDSSSHVSRSAKVSADCDPITGAKPWMLDLECSMLDVDRSASPVTPTHSPVDKGGASQ
jgi:four helix bundle protein